MVEQAEAHIQDMDQSASCEHEIVMRLAGQVIVELGRSGEELARQRAACRLASAWLQKGTSWPLELTRKKHDANHPEM